MRREPITIGMVVTVGIFVCVGVIIALTPDPVAGAAPPSASTMQMQTESVLAAVKTSQRTIQHIGAGVLLGAGIGSILGSIGVFLYWDNQL